MTTITRHSYKLSLKRATRRRRRNPHRKSSTTIDPLKPFEGKCKLSQKLEALKNLIPTSHSGEEVVKPDQLFKETAEYIVLLRTRVVVLQKLIEYYGNSDTSQNESEHVVLFS
ncbi:hypothetical protein VNO78_33811 [Psophocarpus tetragonolobus]|uniref:Uncharacterized protein n=1 Tax=Psophocarpus tetragonolobus TaxID=3891 RepID=A0AAN9NXN5_PSOTE